MTIKKYLVILLASAGPVFGQAAPAASPAAPSVPAAASAAVPAAAPGSSGIAAARTSLDPQPAPNAQPLPAAADTLLRGYGQQAQQSLILAYFSVGTLADSLLGGSLKGPDGLKLADSYLTLATSGRDDLRRVRAAYVLDAGDLDQLDKFIVAYGDVIPMIEAARQLAGGPANAEYRAAFEASRRKAFATLAALFEWK